LQKIPSAKTEKYRRRLGSVVLKGESYMRAGVGYKMWCLVRRGQDYNVLPIIDARIHGKPIKNF
jgi:hypothetical protein